MATTVLGLKTFAASDPVDYNEINDNYNKIDGGVKTALQGRAAHNLLDNSDFNINQRGSTSYTANGYTVDRWAISKWSNDSSVSINLSVNNNGVSLTGGVSSASTPSSCYIYQKIDCARLAGKTLTAAVYIESLSGSGTGIIGAYNGQTYIKGTKLKAGLNFVPFDVPGSATVLMIMIGNDASIGGQGSITASIKWAALYKGSYTADTLPAYQPKGYAAELAECQRYYQTIPALTHIPGVTNTSVSFGAKYKIPTMRIAPTVSIASGQEVSIYTGDYSVSTTGYTMQYASNPNQITLNITLSAGSFVAYKPGMLTSPVDIALSADL